MIKVAQPNSTNNHQDPPCITTRISEVTRMLYLLNYGGGNLADAVGHGDPTGGADLGDEVEDDDLLGVDTDLHLILTLGADHMTILTARYRGSSGDGEAYWTLYRLLQLLQEALCFPSLLAQLHLSLPQPRL